MKNFLFIFLIFFSISGCKKYPGGPSFSLRSPERRLYGSWAMGAIYKDNITKSLIDSCCYWGLNAVILFNKDKTVVIGFQVFNHSNNFQYFPESIPRDKYNAIYGIWELVDKKEILKISMLDTLGNIITFRWRIKQIEKKSCGEFGEKKGVEKKFVVNAEGVDNYEFHFKETFDDGCKNR